MDAMETAKSRHPDTPWASGELHIAWNSDYRDAIRRIGAAPTVIGSCCRAGTIPCCTAA